MRGAVDHQRVEVFGFFELAHDGHDRANAREGDRKLSRPLARHAEGVLMAERFVLKICGRGLARRAVEVRIAHELVAPTLLALPIDALDERGAGTQVFERLNGPNEDLRCEIAALSVLDDADADLCRLGMEKIPPMPGAPEKGAVDVFGAFAAADIFEDETRLDSRRFDAFTGIAVSRARMP